MIKISLATVLLLPMQTVVTPVSAGAHVSATTHVTQNFSAAKDPTRNLTKAQRKKISFKVWIKSPTAKFLKKKESSNNCKAVGYKGRYRGTWQMNAGFWKTYGGKKYAARPDLATCKEQDRVAYKGWLARGWNPWPPAKNFKP